VWHSGAGTRAQRHMLDTRELTSHSGVRVRVRVWVRVVSQVYGIAVLAPQHHTLVKHVN